jgi:hypothetical protein
MSVLIPDLKIYEYVYIGLNKIAYKTEVNHFYSTNLRAYLEGKDYFTEIERLVKNWLVLNERSYNIKYNDNSEIYLTDFLKLGNSYYVKLVQLIKYLRCIQYNIELCTIEQAYIVSFQDNEDYILLQNIITDLTNNYLTQSEEYEKSNWGNF